MTPNVLTPDAEPTTPGDGQNFDLYQHVTDKIVDALERGVVPWRKPWKGAAGGVQVNIMTGRPYRGINQFLLTLSEYGSPYWLTMRQANKIGAKVRKGERSTIVVFWKQLRKKIKPGDDVRSGTRIVTDPDSGQKFALIFLLRYYRVFNVEQLEGLEDGLVPEADEEDELPLIDVCEEVVADYYGPNDGRKDGPSLRLGGDRAYYMPALDHVQLPPRESFESAEAFYATAFHEAIHSTGHEHRLNRPEVTGKAGASFGSEPYGKEELVAEMGAAMVCAVAQIDTPALDDNTAAYIGSWLKTIRGDKKLVISAAGRAQAAADWVLGENLPGSDDESKGE